jgi:cell division protein FtsI/penicillin-binding protein 2
MINSRALIITLFVFAVFASLVFQLFSVQIGGHEQYSARASRQQNTTYTLRAERGIIYDRNNEILAYTKDDVSLFADSRMLRNKRENQNRLATKLSEVFGTKPEKYIKKITNARGNVCLEKKIPKDKALLLSEFVIDGFFKKEDFTRIYPYGNITSHILGYVDFKCIGRAGIESMHDAILSGSDGLLHIENDAVGRPLSINYEKSIPALPGNSLKLTIDKVYQKILVQELRSGIKEFEGISGIGIIANPNNGEILAMANIPDFDPQNYFQASNFERRNRALTDTYEPGSTMKSIVMALLLENNIVDEKNIINTENGKYRINGALIRDTHKFKKLTVKEVLEQSSNIGMVKLSDKIGERQFYKGLRDFGFGNLTSIDMLGETKGSLKKPDKYSGISKAFISHGYEISVTPIQMVMAYSALINGGKLFQPYVTKEIINPEGEVEKKFNPVLIRRLISSETSERIRKIMLGVVENGTGSLAQQENVYVGGKTGTSQKLVNGKYSSKHYNSSFIGFFPADKPELIIFILIDSPQKGRYGGQVAAPIFGNITKKIMETDFSIERNKNEIQRENLLQKFVEEMNNDEEDIYTFANVSSPKNKTAEKENIVRATMPNLHKKSLREAIAILSKLNVKYIIKGSGRIVDQSIKPGKPLSNGMMCILSCSNEYKGSPK